MSSFLGKAVIMAHVMFTTIWRQARLDSDPSWSSCTITVGILLSTCRKQGSRIMHDYAQFQLLGITALCDGTVAVHRFL
jgi:hypothetical protein